MSTMEDLNFRDEPDFQCLEAIVHYRNGVSGVPVYCGLIVRDVSSDDKSQIFVLCAELKSSVTARLTAYFVEVFDSCIL